jgi:hypothetical protein
MRESDLRIASGKWDSDNGIIPGKLLIFLVSLQDKIQQSTFVLRPGTLMEKQDICLISGNQMEPNAKSYTY